MTMGTYLEGPNNYNKTVNNYELAEMYSLSEPTAKVCLKTIVYNARFVSVYFLLNVIS